jgi:integrase/recombinase XerD
MSEFNELHASFTEHLKVKNYSPQSVAAYSGHLRLFLDHLTENNIIDVKRVTRDVLKDYQQKIIEQKTGRTKDGGYAVGTISMKTRAVKRFFEYLEDAGTILINPAEHIKEPKKKTRLPRVVLSEDEVRKILDQPNLSTLVGIRDRAVLEVFYSTGIRLEELTTLTIFDCDLQGGLLRVKGKFSKDRVVPLGKHAVRFLKEYITSVRPQHAKSNKQLRTLFVNQWGGSLSKQVIELMVRRYAKQAKINKQVTPHVFRHTFATELVRNGADIRAVQEMLGHADLKSTHVYIRVAGIEVKNTHTMSHPREKDKETSEEAEPDIRKIKERRWKKRPDHEQLQ